ncbi:hypothetical protein K231HA_01908 [Lactococcus lactis]|uniref:hypothetical protein n=1 Tax=Lactococcus lactis TaxID=1358 RepID=UPI0028FD63EE|nr:hypothetical protein [Lactococcus lactis]MDU0411855.1 hypothetical protein [Lactococcus lactis]
MIWFIDGLKNCEWRKINLQAQVVVRDARSSFSPVEIDGITIPLCNMKPLISTFKSPYIARELLRYASKWHGARLVLGSATPS